MVLNTHIISTVGSRGWHSRFTELVCCKLPFSTTTLTSSSQKWVNLVKYYNCAEIKTIVSVEFPFAPKERNEANLMWLKFFGPKSVAHYIYSSMPTKLPSTFKSCWTSQNLLLKICISPIPQPLGTSYIFYSFLDD